MEKTSNQVIIENDILQYKTNKTASSLALLSIVFSCLYFCLLYSFRNKFFARFEIGFSVILTLFTLLITFLSSEGIKNYNKKYCITLLVLAVIQIIRIFGLPLQALNYDVANGVAGEVETGALTVRYFGIDLIPSVAYIILVVWLCASAACLVLAAVFGYINCVKLEKHVKQLQNGEIDIDRTLKEMDEEDARNAAQEEPVAPAESEEVHDA